MKRVKEFDFMGDCEYFYDTNGSFIHKTNKS